MYKLEKNIALTSMGLNFYGFKSGRLHEKHAVIIWNLGNISEFA
jgi:hypothetical protein